MKDHFKKVLTCRMECKQICQRKKMNCDRVDEERKGNDDLLKATGGAVCEMFGVQVNG